MPLAVVTILLAIVLIWVPLSLYSVLTTGWFDLSKQFPPQPTGPVKHIWSRGVTTVLLKDTNRGRIAVRYVADTDALHIKPISIAATLLKQISIPWAAIERAYVNSADTELVRVQLTGYETMIALPRKFVQFESEVRDAIKSG